MQCVLHACMFCTCHGSRKNNQVFHDACMIWLHHGFRKNNQVSHDACMHAEICILACLMLMLLHQFMPAFSCTFIPLLCFYVSCPFGNNQAFMMHACMLGYVTPFMFDSLVIALVHACILACGLKTLPTFMLLFDALRMRLTHVRTQ